METKMNLDEIELLEKQQQEIANKLAKNGQASGLSLSG